MADFFEVVKARRSVRRYTTDQVSDEDIQKVLEAGRWAPTGGNTQPCEFILVRDKHLLQSIGSLLVADREKLFAYDPLFPGSRVDYLKNIGAMIVVCADPRFTEFYPLGDRRDSILYLSVGAVVENMFLAATALGLGTVWITIKDGAERELRDLLGIPRDMEVHVVMPLGYPGVEEKHLYRRELSEVVHRDRYESGKRVPDAVLEQALSSKESRRQYRLKGPGSFK